MTTIIEAIMIGTMICLGIIVSFSDIRTGIISNKTLIIFLAIGVVIDLMYYKTAAKNDLSAFAMNIVVVSAMSIGLYATHALAGGDCKLIPVMSLLYPAGKYMTYANTHVTLFLAVCLAILYGYVFLLCISGVKLISKKNHIEARTAKTYVLSYLKSYLTAFLYVILANLTISLVDRNLISVAPWIFWISCIAAAWIGGRIQFLRRRPVIAAVILIDVFLSFFLGTMPISLNPRSYIFTALLVLCQMMIRTNLYDSVSTSSVKKGMILSVYSTAIMQNSRVKGLPGMSFEDLRSRLTESEAESVRRWGGSAKGTQEIIIVKKIPFAVFITLGYISYLLIWRFVL